MDINEIRQLFHHLQKGKIYFNHAATGPLSERVISALNAFLKNSSEGRIDDYEAFLKIFEDTKKELGNYINCSPDRIAFLDNTTNGMNVIAGGIEWEKGDNIILNDIEYPANVYPFLNLERKGVEINFVHSHNGIVSAEDIINAFNSRTKLVSVSQVQFVSGYRIDLKALGKECRNKNIILSVDAIQGLGAVNIDVINDYVDFLSCGIQKWLMGLQGLSFIYVSEELQKRMHPACLGWLSVKDPWNHLEYKLDLKNDAGVFQTGTINTAGLISLNASIKLMKEFGFPEIEKRVLDNSGYLIDRLSSMGINPVADADRKYLSGIVSFKYGNVQKIFEYLDSRNISCAVRGGALRISPHFYNTRDDIDKFMSVLKEAVK